MKPNNKTIKNKIRTEDMTVAHAVSEFFPYSKTGGLGHAAADITRNLALVGIHTIVFTPLYGSVKKKIGKKLVEVVPDTPLELDKQTTINYSCSSYTEKLPGGKTLTIYFINNYNFFGRYLKNLYSHPETHKNYYFFTRAVIDAIEKLNLKIDIIHTHDWMCGLFPELVKGSSIKGNLYKRKMPKTVFTIHNLGYQGSNEVNMSRHHVQEKITAYKDLPKFSDNAWNKINFMRHGIHYTDMVTTVSLNYACEILSEQYGEGLAPLLRRKYPIYGIANGIDNDFYNPKKSKYLYYNYNVFNVAIQKKKNKIKLLTKLNIPKESHKFPLLVFPHRLAYQKGIDLLMESLDELMTKDVIVVVMGEGDYQYTRALTNYESKFSEKFKFIKEFTDSMENKLYAGADIILCPSVYEPCGTSHLKAMRFGTIPVVRKVGGLADTVSDYNYEIGSGTGFMFLNFNVHEFQNCIERAVNIYCNHKVKWFSIVQNCMIQDFTWQLQIQEYTYLYENLMRKGFKSTSTTYFYEINDGSK